MFLRGHLHLPPPWGHKCDGDRNLNRKTEPEQNGFSSTTNLKSNVGENGTKIAELFTPVN